MNARQTIGRCPQASPYHVAVANEAERNKVVAEIYKSLDAWENSCVPTATLDCNSCEFGELVANGPAEKKYLPRSPTLAIPRSNSRSSRSRSRRAVSLRRCLHGSI